MTGEHLADLFKKAEEIPREEIGPILVALAALQGRLAIKLVSTPENGIRECPEKWLTAAEATAVTGIPRSWLHEAARQGRVPHIKAGKYVRFRMSDLIKALEFRQHLKKAE